MKLKMLGRKPSLRSEPILSDYGPDESLNENADIDWVNKVRDISLLMSALTALMSSSKSFCMDVL